MKSAKDIYIVYSDRDNDPKDKNQWIFNFHRFLELLLSRLAGESISIRLIKDSTLDVELIYSPGTIFIPLVSPGLLRSPNFKDEIKKFHERAINKGENNIEWNSRIFKVLRYPQQEHYLLDYLNTSVNYNFYHVDPSTEKIVHYEDFTGDQSKKTFWLRLYDLAFDLYKILERIYSVQDEIRLISDEINTKSIYLANVGVDMMQKRDEVKRELLRNGYKVYPEINLQDNLQAAEKTIRADLAKCCLSVHIVGADFGNITGSDLSFLELQNKLATEHFRELSKMNAPDSFNLGKIIWIAPELQYLTAKQKLYIENLKKESDHYVNLEVMESGIEELKTFVVDKVMRAKEEQREVVDSGMGKVIYLISEKDELRACKKVKRYLEDQGHVVLMSRFDGKPEEIRSSHTRNLIACDATIIYYGKGSEDWMKSKAKDLMKALGLGRNKPISPQAVLVENEDQLIDPVEMETDDVILFKSGKFNANGLQPFLLKLNAIE